MADKMSREEAEEYLERKGELYVHRTKQEIKELNEKEIEKVMKKGKIYGDPTAEIQW